MTDPAVQTPIDAATAYEESASLRSRSRLGVVLAAFAVLLTPSSRAAQDDHLEPAV